MTSPWEKLQELAATVVGPYLQVGADALDIALTPEVVAAEQLAFNVTIQANGTLAEAPPVGILRSGFNFSLVRMYAWIEPIAIGGILTFPSNLVTVTFKEDAVGRDALFRGSTNLANLVSGSGSSSPIIWDAPYKFRPGAQIEAEFTIDDAWANDINDELDCGVLLVGVSAKEPRSLRPD